MRVANFGLQHTFIICESDQNSVCVCLFENDPQRKIPMSTLFIGKIMMAARRNCFWRPICYRHAEIISERHKAFID